MLEKWADPILRRIDTPKKSLFRNRMFFLSHKNPGNLRRPTDQPPQVYPKPPDAFVKKKPDMVGHLSAHVASPISPSLNSVLFLFPHLFILVVNMPLRFLALFFVYSRETSRPKSLDLAQSFITKSRFRAEKY